MSLPDLTTLEAADASTLAKLRARLTAIGVVPARLEPIVRAAGATHPLLRRPLLQYHLRKIREPHAFASRALMFGDPVTREELDLALGDLAEPARAMGLVVESDAGFVSRFCLTVVEGLYLLTDDLSQGGEAVMGLGPATIALCTAAMPRERLGLALDLGCGAGTVALAISRRVEKVVATDVNPRALAFTRLNARLNDISNVEVREGSLFEPVKGESFHLVASQPPWVPQADDGKSGTFMRGGRRGDELAIALFSNIVEHLVPRGRGVIVSEWGQGPGIEPPAAPIKTALAGAPADVLLFQHPASSCDAHAVEYAAALHPRLGPEFEAEARARREHCATVGFDVLVPTLCVVRRVDDRRPRSDVLPSGPLARIAPNSKRIDRLLLARDVVNTIDTLLGAKVRIVEGAALREEQAGPGRDVESTLSAVLPPKAMTETVALTPMLLRLATCIHESATVRAGIDAYIEQYEAEEKPEMLAATIGRSLLSGFLELAD